MTARAVIATAVLAVLVIAALQAVTPEQEPPTPAAQPSVAAPSPAGAPTETVAEQVERVAAVVADLRGLDFTTTPDPVILAPEDLSDRIADEMSDFTEEQADLERRILSTLGAIDADADLRDLVTAGYTEQVAGFYELEDKELVVGASDPSQRLGRLEEIVLAHELQHALADQALGLPDLAAIDETRSDELLATQAVIEGDATVTMQEYIAEGFSLVDQLLLPAELAQLDEQLAGATDLPHYVQRSLTFPYEEGSAYVAALRRRGAWQAVDDAYEQPPVATIEVLDPRVTGPPVDIAAPAMPPPPWEERTRTQFGAADLLFLFEAPGDDPSAALEGARSAAETWRGGQLLLAVDGDDSAVGVAIAVAGPGLCDASRTWYRRAFPDAVARGDDLVGDTQAAVITCSDTEVRWGIAPDLDAAERLAAAA